MMMSKVWLVSVSCLLQAWSSSSSSSSSSSCPPLECWSMEEKVGRGGLTPATSQEKALLIIGGDARSRVDPESDGAWSHICPDRIFHVTDPAATLCQGSLGRTGGSAEKVQCEMSRFQQQPSFLKWTAPLTDSGLSPVHLQADWFSLAVRDPARQAVISSIMRAPDGSKESSVILSVSTKTGSLQARLGRPTVLDCGFWVDPSWPLSASGFAVEWRYQFQGKGRVILAYDGKTDRLADEQEEGASLDFEALHKTGNASLVLHQTKVHHSGRFICTVYLPYLQAQVAVDLQIAEPPSLSIQPSPVPLALPGQTVVLRCDAWGFTPLSLELSWEFTGPDGKSRELESSSMTGHRQAWDGTYGQSAQLELHTSALGSGGEVTCVAVHPTATRRTSVSLSVIGFTSPSVEDSMAMVGVALVLYGFIKLLSSTVFSSGADVDENQERKDK